MAIDFNNLLNKKGTASGIDFTKLVAGLQLDGANKPPESEKKDGFVKRTLTGIKNEYTQSFVPGFTEGMLATPVAEKDPNMTAGVLKGSWIAAKTWWDSMETARKQYEDSFNVIFNDYKEMGEKGVFNKETTGMEKAASFGRSTLSTATSIIAPFAAISIGGSALPKPIGNIFDGINAVMNGMGTGVASVAVDGLYQLPLEEKNKETLAPLVADTTSLITMLGLSVYFSPKGTPAAPIPTRRVPVETETPGVRSVPLNTSKTRWEKYSKEQGYEPYKGDILPPIEFGEGTKSKYAKEDTNLPTVDYETGLTRVRENINTILKTIRDDENIQSQINFANVGDDVPIGGAVDTSGQTVPRDGAVPVQSIINGLRAEGFEITQIQDALNVSRNIGTPEAPKYNPIEVATKLQRLIAEPVETGTITTKGGGKKMKPSATEVQVVPGKPNENIKQTEVARDTGEIRYEPIQEPKPISKAYENVLTWFSGAEKGERVGITNPDGTFAGYVAKESSFPGWVPEALRNRPLFDKWMEGRDGTTNDLKIKYKPGSRLDRLDKVVKQYLEEVEMEAMSQESTVGGKPVTEETMSEENMRGEGEGSRLPKPIEGTGKERMPGLTEQALAQEFTESGLSDVPIYRSMNMKEIANKILRYSEAELRGMLRGERELPPENDIPAMFIWRTLYKRQKQTGDVRLAEELAYSDITLFASRAGQELRSAVGREPDHVVDIIQEVSNEAKKIYEKGSGKDAEVAVTETMNQIKKAIMDEKISAKDLAAFLKEITCT